MNTPFSQPNLANFIKTGTDAVVSKVTFPDGRSQTTARPPYSFIKYEVSGAVFTVKTGAPADANPNQFDVVVLDRGQGQMP